MSSATYVQTELDALRSKCPVLALQLAPDGIGTNADRLYRCTQLGLGAAKFLAPPTDFPGFVDVNATAVRRSAII